MRPPMGSGTRCHITNLVRLVAISLSDPDRTRPGPGPAHGRTAEGQPTMRQYGRMAESGSKSWRYHTMQPFLRMLARARTHASWMSSTLHKGSHIRSAFIVLTWH